MAKKKIMLKAQTHYGTIELPMTQAKALAFSKKLLATHRREISKWNGGYKKYWWKSPPKVDESKKPYCKLEFIEL